MRVVVDSNFAMSGVFEPPVTIELEGPSATLKDLLMKLSERMKIIEFISQNIMGSDIATILINEKQCHNLAIGIKDGDKVTIEIEMTALGGG